RRRGDVLLRQPARDPPQLRDGRPGPRDLGLSALRVPRRTGLGEPPGPAEDRAVQDAPGVRERTPQRRGRRGHPRRGPGQAPRAARRRQAGPRIRGPLTRTPKTRSPVGPGRSYCSSPSGRAFAASLRRALRAIAVSPQCPWRQALERLPSAGGVAGAAVAYMCFVAGLGRVTAAAAGTLSLAEPLVAAGLAVLLLGERVPAPDAAGALLLL